MDRWLGVLIPWQNEKVSERNYDLCLVYMYASHLIVDSWSAH